MYVTVCMYVCMYGGCHCTCVHVHVCIIMDIHVFRYDNKSPFIMKENACTTHSAQVGSIAGAKRVCSQCWYV